MRVHGIRVLLTVFFTIVIFSGVQSHAQAAGITASGTVRSAATRELMPGVIVRATDVTAYAAGITPSFIETLTTSDGSYEIGSLVPGRLYSFAFMDTSGVYRDETFPQRGLPISEAFAFEADSALSLRGVNADLSTKSSVIASRVRRVQGADRYHTALATSRENWASADTVVLASGANFPDALAASPLAGSYGAPILLTPPSRLPSGLLAELRRLGSSRVIIVGGEEAVSRSVANAIKSAGYSVERIGGENRYDTAAQIAARVISLNGAWYRPPIICRGDSFADALATSPIAYITGSAILLTRPDALPPETRRIYSQMASPAGNDQLYVVGGTPAVSDTVLGQLAAARGGRIYYYRFAGPDRYSTALALATESGLFNHADVIGLARGDDYPDALAGGAACGWDFGPLLLTPPPKLDRGAKSYLQTVGPYVIRFRAFGAEAALSEGTLATARSALGTRLHDIDTDPDPMGLPDRADVAAATIAGRPRIAPPMMTPYPAKPDL